MTSVISALDSFKLDIGRYPDTLGDLLILPGYAVPDKYQTGGYLKEMPKDGWQNEFAYRRVRRDGVETFQLVSWGADGRKGGVGADQDIEK